MKNSIACNSTFTKFSKYFSIVMIGALAMLAVRKIATIVINRRSEKLAEQEEAAAGLNTPKED